MSPGSSKRTRSAMKRKADVLNVTQPVASGSHPTGACHQPRTASTVLESPASPEVAKERIVRIMDEFLNSERPHQFVSRIFGPEKEKYCSLVESALVPTPATLIATTMADWLQSPCPSQQARRLIQDKVMHLKRVNDALFPDRPSTQLGQSRLPRECKDLIYKHVVQTFFTLSLRQHDAIVHGPASAIAKFTAQADAVVVMRGVLSPSATCPDFLPDLAKDSEEERQLVGQAFLQEATFVFLGGYGTDAFCSYGVDEMLWFRRFVGTLSDDRVSGYSLVRSLVFPAFAYNRDESSMVDLVLDCVGLDSLTLGFAPDALCTDIFDERPCRLRDVEDYMDRSRLRELRYASHKTVKLIMGPCRRRAHPAVVAGFGPWLMDLGKKLKENFVAARKPSVKVYVDEDTKWDQGGSGREREIA